MILIFILYFSVLAVVLFHPPPHQCCPTRRTTTFRMLVHRAWPSSLVRTDASNHCGTCINSIIPKKEALVLTLFVLVCNNQTNTSTCMLNENSKIVRSVRVLEK